ncbi:putative electron transport protein [Melioribacter roseus P3M-2]|uniref:Putative electron transport protein n=1 Tax=Melioribacter roseus (strain DSM 23840 / JCM 17771 / VKM B-2668 / P3M-2) TaxID=1191523 RepID=I6ZQI8_MELRP|nr:4Fe-4S binding protein [Melioribacter roseus]AFN74339.1 putative electron transport protein [Melioribacter roseus P3M-2]
MTKGKTSYKFNIGIYSLFIKRKDCYEGKEKIIRNVEKAVQKYRFAVQVLFALLCIWIGVEFTVFVKSLEAGNPEMVSSRPAGVEGFLPISALMSVYYFFATGEIHPAHPAGFFIFLAIVGVSLVVGKSFCSWLCPIGFLSETIGDFGEKIWHKLFKKRIKLPRFIDYPLRSLKYLLLGFFVYAIFFSMTINALKAFLDGPYNLVADIKMYYFFANISRFSLTVIAVLFVLSIFIRNFWCRYLCPYGALLGLISFLSPLKIKREAKSCIDCGLCAKACPSFIKVDKVDTVRSDECSMCLSCVDACPVADTLYVQTKVTDKKISKKIVVLAVITTYIAITGIGILTGHWKNNISGKEYIILHEQIDNLGHPTSTADIEKLNKETETGVNK